MRALRPPALSRPRPKSPLLVLASWLEHRPGRSAGVIGPTSAGVVENSIADRASRTTLLRPRAAGAAHSVSPKSGAIRRGAPFARKGSRRPRQAPRAETRKDGM